MHGYNPDGTMYCTQADLCDAVERAMYWTKRMHGGEFDLTFGIVVEKLQSGWYKATVKVK